ncbi:amidase [Podospora appendiculata]|uniref:Amidase n=1 Tax=Podospora appendiculata TaxID=314037 RepID=A0AAE1CCT8_9PEZI|nr:amidase [Podospora appendiculata]
MGSIIPGIANWELIGAKKRASLIAAIPPEWTIPADLLPPPSQDDVTTFPSTSGWFTPSELAITNSTAADLVAKLADGTLTSVAVTRAFCKRAAAAHQLTNCLSEILFDQALETAAKLDAHLARTGKPLGPLHGLPISLKDNFNLVGLDSTVGFTSHVGHPATEDATLAELLRDKCGAVFYVKTSVPTAMMIAETVNNVLGRTVHPRNRKLTSGGSSGGEAALILFGGSVLGVGTDIGGSLRIPAACTGIFTLRPSFGRFPTGRCRSGLPGQEAVHSVNGPLARTLDDIDLYSRAVIDAQPWQSDPKCLPIPWRPTTTKKLKVGVIWHDGMVIPTPPVTRALKETVAKLRAAGHEVIDWPAGEEHKLGESLLSRMFLADGGRAIRAELEKTGEPWRPEMLFYAGAQDMGCYNMWKLHMERTEFQKRYLDRWRESGMDAILCPTTPFSTVEHGRFRHVGYTGVFNVLDYSCISFPSGVSVDKDVDISLLSGDGTVARQASGYVPLSETCAAIHAEYNPDVVHGMPVSLQLVAGRLQEEDVIAMCKAVLKVIE